MDGWNKLGVLAIGAAGLGFAAFVFLVPYKGLRGEVRRLGGDLAAQRAATKELIGERDRLRAESSRPGDQARAIRAAAFRARADAITTDLTKSLAPAGADVAAGGDRILVRLSEKAIFEAKGADISESGEGTLLALGQVLKGQSDIRVRLTAHLDGAPVPADLRDLFPTGWELSAARATNVVRFLADEAGVSPKLLIAAGGGEHHAPAGGSKAMGPRRLDLEIEPE